MHNSNAGSLKYFAVRDILIITMISVLYTNLYTSDAVRRELDDVTLVGTPKHYYFSNH